MQGQYTPEQDIMLSFKKPPLERGQFNDAIFEKNLARTAGKNPEISAIIVAYNEGEEILNLIAALARQDFAKPYEIILVDNGLEKNLAQKIKSRYTGVSYIKLKGNLGASEGRNVGSVFAGAPVLAFLDADGLVGKDYLKNVHRVFTASDTLIAARGRIRPLTPGSHIPDFYDLGDKSLPYYINTEGVSAWRTRDFIKTGGLEKDLYSLEGLALCYRMIEFYGYEPKQFHYEPALVLKHDYHRPDRNHLIDKTTKKTHLMIKMKNRYPFIIAMMRNFRALSNFSDNEDEGMDIDMALTGKIKAEVAGQYEAYYDRLAVSRGQKSAVKNPKFSVVIAPDENKQAEEKTLNSILRQSLQDVEIINQDKKLPAGEARNKAVKSARCEYIVCLTPGDILEPTYLEKACNLFEAYPKIGAVLSWSKAYGYWHKVAKPADNPKIIDVLTGLPEPIAPCFRKEAWDKTGGYMKQGYIDRDLLIGILKNGWQVRTIPGLGLNHKAEDPDDLNPEEIKADMKSLVERHRDILQGDFAEIISAKHEEATRFREKSRKLERENTVNKAKVKSLREQIGLKAALRLQTKRFKKS